MKIRNEINKMSTSRSMNKVMLIGNLTRDPALKQLPNGAMICTFGIATNKSWKDATGQLREKAEFHNVVAWNKLAEICSNVLSVGMLVYVEGEIVSEAWETNGVRVVRYEIRIEDMKIMDAKEKKGVGMEQAMSNAKVDNPSMPSTLSNENPALEPVESLSATDIEVPTKESDVSSSFESEDEKLF